MTPNNELGDGTAKWSPGGDQTDFDKRIRQFEQAWLNGDLPQIEQYLAGGSDENLLLLELVHADMEFRLRAAEPARIEEYLAKFPALAATIDNILDLARTEMRVRLLLGEQVAVSEYQQRFPQLDQSLSSMLSSFDVATEGQRSASAEDSAATFLSRPGLRIRCPHCHQPVEILCDDVTSDVTCSVCGSTFNIASDNANTYTTPTVRQIAHFELLERVGVGAFGAVWKARDTELDRTVAVKIPRKNKIEKEEVEKFLREARSAAQLRHPNIVSVYEVGRDGETLFIVSELIRGVSLADWMTATRCTAHEAANLCRTIALALHAAHESGVVHRDLKPGNILIDERNEPHITDFGLAKRDVGEITMTMDGQPLGTPAYMSPEQARGEAHGADRRTDVYSLGVLLFELLTGERPFRGNQRMVLHQVLNNEPRSPRSLNDRVPRDLETVCLRAMAKEPARRYSTAADLADDLGRFLRGRPVVARPITRVERAWRWCKRQPVVSSLLAAVILSLAGGTVVSTVFAVRATRAETEAKRQRDEAVRQSERADEEAAIAKAVNEFLQSDLLAQADPYQQVEPSQDLTLRAALDRAADRVGGRFENQPLLEAALRQTIGQAYHSLGQYEKSQQQLERALEIRRRELGEGDLDTLTSIYTLARVLWRRGKYAQAEPLFLQALEGRRKTLGDEHRETLTAVHGLAALYRAMGQYEQAEPLFLRNLSLQRQSLGDDHFDTLETLNSLGVLYLQQGKLEQSERFATEAFEGRRKTLRREHPETLLSATNLGMLYLEQDKYAQAETLLAETVEVLRKVLGEHPWTRSALQGLSLARLRQKKYPEATPLSREYLELCEKMGPDDWSTFYARALLGWALLGEGKHAEAEPLLLAGYEGMKAREKDAPPIFRSRLSEFLERLVQLYDGCGEPEEAEKWRKKLEAEKQQVTKSR